MTLIFDSEVYTVGEMRNRAFRRKISSEAIQAMYAADGTTDPRFDLYDFQDDPLLVGAINTGTSGVLGNMAWTNGGLRSGDGWYTPPYIPGARGFGMVNNGGASGFVGSCGSHSGNELSATNKFTIIAIVKVVSTGEAAQGRIFQKDNDADPGTLLYTFGTNQLEMDIGAGSATTINNAFVPNYWHVVTVSFDGGQAAGSRCKIYVDGFDKTAADLTDATITDDGNIMYFLDNFANTRAFNGIMGLFAICPQLAMSQAQSQSLIELKGHFQATAGTQADIPAGMGIFGPPDYRFVRANSDHFLSFQVQPLKTAQGTILIDFAGDDVTNEQILFGLSNEGVAAIAADEMTLEIRGDIVNDPIELMRRSGGATNLRLSTPFGAGRLGVRTRYVITSDGTAIYAYMDGVNQVVSAVLGANTGQWLNSVASSDVSVIGRSRTAAPIGDLQGRISTIKVYDRFMPQIEAQKVCYNIHHSGGSRWYPRA